MLKAVTISTNMGRGTDIKLGGENGIEKDAK
jgi:preprotein translocase subunit SecA